MMPTLTIGDHILVKKGYYNLKLPFSDESVFRFWPPQRGDIVVFKYPEDETKDFIKRVIGLPGEVVEIRNKQVYVNQQPLEEPYTVHNDPTVYPREAQPRDYFGPVTVPQDSYFMMGDNRDHSLDSRYWGFVKFSKIKGKVFIIYWSWDKNDFRVRWDRVGMAF
jgi:signal peptidase I